MNCNVDIQGFSTNLNNGAEGSFGVDANGDQSYAFVLDYHGSFGSDVTVSFDILFDPGDADFPGFGNLPSFASTSGGLAVSASIFSISDDPSSIAYHVNITVPWSSVQTLAGGYLFAQALGVIHWAINPPDGTEDADPNGCNLFLLADLSIPEADTTGPPPGNGSATYSCPVRVSGFGSSIIANPVTPLHIPFNFSDDLAQDLSIDLSLDFTAGGSYFLGFASGPTFTLGGTLSDLAGIMVSPLTVDVSNVGIYHLTVTIPWSVASPLGIGTTPDQGIGLLQWVNGDGIVSCSVKFFADVTISETTTTTPEPTTTTTPEPTTTTTPEPTTTTPEPTTTTAPPLLPPGSPLPPVSPLPPLPQIPVSDFFPDGIDFSIIGDPVGNADEDINGDTEGDTSGESSASASSAYHVPGTAPVLPPLPPALPSAPCPDGIIRVYIEAETIPIQSGGLVSRTTSWVMAQALVTGEYTILFHGRRTDQSEVVIPVNLVVADPLQKTWNFPVVTEKQLPLGTVGVEYSNLKHASLLIGSVADRNQLYLSSLQGGTSGNSLTLAVTVPTQISPVLPPGSPPTPIPNRPLSVNVSSRDITVSLATSGFGGISSSADDLKQALRNNSSSANLITVSSIGDTTGIPDLIPKTNFSGGLDPTPVLHATSGSAKSSQGFCTDISVSSTSPPTASDTGFSYLWSVSPGVSGTSGLPAGLQLNAATGAIFGIPLNAGEYRVTVHVTDNFSNRTTVQLPLSIVEGRKGPSVKSTDVRTSTHDVYIPEISLPSLSAPIHDSIIQNLSPVRDLKRSYWGPVSLAKTLSTAGTIDSVLAAGGVSSVAMIQMTVPSGPGPWTEIRVSFFAYKDTANTVDFKTVLTVRPMSGGLPLRSAVDKSTLPLDYDSTFLHQLVWRGLWFEDDFRDLAICLEPRFNLGINDSRLATNRIKVQGFHVNVRSIPLPNVSLTANLLISGQPVGTIQATPTLTDDWITYELLWLGHWTKHEIEELSVVLEPHLVPGNNDAYAATPWVMISNLDLITSVEPPPILPLPPVVIPDLLEVSVTPSGAADPLNYTFTVNITSNGYSGIILPTVTWVGVNPGLTIGFNADRFNIASNQTIQILLAVTAQTATVGSLGRFVVVLSAADGSGSGSSRLISFLVAAAPPAVLPLPPAAAGSTAFLVDVFPGAAEIPIYGIATFAVKITALLGTTTVSLSTGIRPFSSFIQRVFAASVVQPSPGNPVSVILQVQTQNAPEGTYSLDILGIGSDGGYAGIQAVLVVNGIVSAPSPGAPPLPVLPPPPYPGVVETLVPDAILSRIGTISGTWSDINSTLDNHDDSSYVQLMFGPPPLSGIAAANYEMTDPVADAIWTILVLRARMSVLRDVQYPTFSFQPYIDNLPVGDPKIFGVQDGLSTVIQNFAWTWVGQWTTNQIRGLVAQVSAYTTGGQAQLNGITLTEFDVLVAGSLRNPLPTSIPIHLIPDTVLDHSGGVWGFSTLSLIEAINSDIDAAADNNYATILLNSGELSQQRLGFSDPPIQATWYNLTVRVRAQVTGGVTGIKMDLTIAGTTVEGSVSPLTVGSWVNYRSVFTGTYDNTDVSGLDVNVTLINADTVSSTVLISGVDVVVGGVPSSLAQTKIVPYYERQSYGVHQGSIVDIWEGLTWPPNAATDPLMANISSSNFSIRPDPLPKLFVSETDSDQDYEVFPLSYDQRSSIIEYGFSDPGDSPELPSPPISAGGYFTAITVRVRLHQDPRVVPPTIINIPPEPPFTLTQSYPSSLPPAAVGKLFPESGGPFKFSVQGGSSPYSWLVHLVTTTGTALAGVPPGLTATQDPDDSSILDYFGTPTQEGIYQFGITVQDNKGRGIVWTVTQDIITPSPPTPPPPVGPPVSPPPGPPPPVLPPPGPPAIPDMLLWMPGYTIGVDPDDITTVWDAPNSTPDPDGLNHRPVTVIQFGSIGQTLSINVGELRELSGHNRTSLQWQALALSDINGVSTPIQVHIKGVPATNTAPTTLPSHDSDQFTLSLTYNGVAGLPDSGTVIIQAIGRPDALGNNSAFGTASGTVYWAYLSPLVILTSQLPNGLVGHAYSETLAAKGGNPPYAWGVLSAVGSGLPSNVTLSSDGHLTGVPIQVGTYLFRIGVVDTTGQTQTINLSITIDSVVIISPPPPVIPPLPPVLPPPLVSPPPPIGPPGPPTFQIDEAPGIDVRIQPLVIDKYTNTLTGLGSTLINSFTIPRPKSGQSGGSDSGLWKNFSATWYGFWTADQLSALTVELQMTLVEPVSVGAHNNLYISALDVIVTKPVPAAASTWLVSMKPEGRIKWMDSVNAGENGPNSGKWRDGDRLYWTNQGGHPTYIEHILGTAHKGGVDQVEADTVLDRYEIFGWLDRDGSGAASSGDSPRVAGQAWLATGIGLLDTTLLIRNLSALKDSYNKYFQGFLIDDELIVIQRDQIDFESGLMNNVWRGYNETSPAFHARGSAVFPVSFWELVYRIKIAGATTVDFKGHALGFDTDPGTDNGTPGDLLQNGPIDLRSFSGDYPIRWLLRLRVSDIYGLTSDSDSGLPNYPDRFISTGAGSFVGPGGNVYIPAKRLLYVIQSRLPGRPALAGGHR
jgi:hypothetical protein